MNYEDEIKRVAELLRVSNIDTENQEACWDFCIENMPKLSSDGEDINPGEEFFLDVMEELSKK